MARIAKCEITEEGCDDPRCKIGACILEAEDRQAEEAGAALRRAKVRDHAIQIVDEVFKVRKRQASPSELEEWLSTPAIQAEAERRVAQQEELARNIPSLDTLFGKGRPPPK